jgi:hypothetical protein
MSRKELAFKKKVVELVLPGCLTVTFDPEKCEWTSSSR